MGRVRAGNRKRRCLLVVLLVLTASFGWAQQAPATPAETHPKSGPTPEDWSSLSLAGSELVPYKPLLGEKNDFPQFTRELIQVQWRKGDPIDLYIIRPKGVTKPPVVLYLYSFPSETERFRNNDYCARITEGGFAAIGFVSALTGHRYAMRPMKEWFVSELQEALGSSVHDVQMILNYLATRDDLDLGRVGMFGAGSGGTIAILAAAADPRIKAIDLLNPWGDWPDWLAKSSVIPENERPSYVKPEFLKKVAPLDPVQWLPQLNSQAIRIQRLRDDEITPEVAEQRIEAAAGARAKVAHYDHAGQFWGAASGGRLFHWVKDQLQPVAPGAKTAAESPVKSQSTSRASGSGHDD
ncbi:MAG: alpha/beta hydrolase family protein [Terriglobales bacterium]